MATPPRAAWSGATRTSATSCARSRGTRSRRCRASPRSSAALVHAAIAAGPVRLAQAELLQLAGRRAGQRVAELDRGRTLVVRQLRAAVIDQIAVAGV